MRRLLKRLGRRKLSREVPVERVRRGHRLDGLTRVGLLVPAVDFAQRKELKELVSIVLSSILQLFMLRFYILFNKDTLSGADLDYYSIVISVSEAIWQLVMVFPNRFYSVIKSKEAFVVNFTKKFKDLDGQTREKLVKILVWFDNEWAYAQRLLDIIQYVGTLGKR